MTRVFLRFAWNESGVTAIEYAMIAAFIVLGIIVSVGQIGTAISTNFYGPLMAGFGG